MNDIIADWLHKQYRRSISKISVLPEDSADAVVAGILQRELSLLASYCHLPQWTLTMEEVFEAIFDALRVPLDRNLLAPAMEGAWEAGKMAPRELSQVSRLASTAWKGELLCDAKGVPHATTANLILIFENDPRWHGLLAWDSMLMAPVANGKLPIDLDMELLGRNAFRARPHMVKKHVRSAEDFKLPIAVTHTAIMGKTMGWLQETYRMNTSSEQQVGHAIVTSSFKQTDNCLMRWAESQEWDGVPRLYKTSTDGEVDVTAASEFAKLFTTDEQYAAEVVTPFLRLFILSWVARLYEPGAKVDTILVLEGDQGTCKSTSMEALLPHRSLYFSGHVEWDKKDALQVGMGCSIFEISELDRLLKNGRLATVIKSWARQPTDKFRLPYAKDVGDYARMFAVYATVNRKGAWLRDSGFQRGYMPVHVNKRVDVTWIENNRGQIVAEARALLEAGWDYFPNAAETELINREMLPRLIPDSLAQTIEESLLRYGCLFVTTSEVSTILLSMPPNEAYRIANQVNDAMESLGWIHTSKARNGSSKKTPGWLAPPTWVQPPPLWPAFDTPVKNRILKPAKLPSAGAEGQLIDASQRFQK